jgi:hypothetical protein
VEIKRDIAIRGCGKHGTILIDEMLCARVQLNRQGILMNFIDRAATRLLLVALCGTGLAACSANMASAPSNASPATPVGVVQKPGMDAMTACQAEANRTWGVSDATATSPLQSKGGVRKSVVQAKGHKGTCTIDAAGTARRVVDD